MEIATRNVIFPGSVGLAQAHPLTKPLAMGDGLPPDLVQLRSTLPIRALVLREISTFPSINIWVSMGPALLGKTRSCSTVSLPTFI